ncbi:primase-like DNA-binding domain-containing protein [Pseudarthrobacter sp. alpha12b]
MNETTALQNLYVELHLDRWFEELLGQKADYSSFNIHKAEASLPRTEIRAAKAIRDMFETRLSYIPTENRWYLWNGKVHAPCDGDGVAIEAVKYYYKAMADALEFIKSHFETLAQHAASSGSASAKEDAAKIRALYDKGEIKKHKSFRDRISTEAGINAVARLLKTELNVPSNHFADDRRWMVIENGVYDLDAVRRDKRFDLLPHDPSRAVYRMLNAEERPGSGYGDLVRFLEQSIADKGQARFYSKAVAWALFGVTDVATKTIVSVQGATNSGKSMMNRVMEDIAESFYAEPKSEAIELYAKGSKSHARHEMQKARYVAFTEVQGQLDKGFVLQYSGGDMIDSEQKYVNAVKWRPQGLMFFVSNDGMKIDTVAPEVYARVAPVNFPHQYHRAEDAKLNGSTYIQDEGLEGRLKANRSGTLEWLKASYLAYLDEGLALTDSMRALKLATRDDSSNAIEFLNEMKDAERYLIDTEAPKSQFIKISEAHTDYVSWCKDHGYTSKQILTQRVFSKHIQTQHPEANSGGRRFDALVKNQTLRVF